MIPHIFHRLWYGPRELPRVYRMYGTTWESQNRGWKLHTWEDYEPNDLGDIWRSVGNEHQPDAGGGKQETAVQVQRADIASYELIYEHGGVYLNCDLEAVGPIADRIHEVDCFLVWEVDGAYPSNACFGAVPGHPFIRHVMDQLPLQMKERAGASMNEQTGPHLLKRALDTYLGPKPPIFPSSVFMTGESPIAVSKHHWGHQVPDHVLWGE